MCREVTQELVLDYKTRSCKNYLLSDWTRSPCIQFAPHTSWSKSSQYWFAVAIWWRCKRQSWTCCSGSNYNRFWKRERGKSTWRTSSSTVTDPLWPVTTGSSRRWREWLQKLCEMNYVQQEKVSVIACKILSHSLQTWLWRLSPLFVQSIILSTGNSHSRNEIVRLCRWGLSGDIWVIRQTTMLRAQHFARPVGKNHTLLFHSVFHTDIYYWQYSKTSIRGTLFKGNSCLRGTLSGKPKFIFQYKFIPIRGTFI